MMYGYLRPHCFVPSMPTTSSPTEFVLCLTSKPEDGNSDLTMGGLEFLTRESGAGVTASSGSVYMCTAFQMEAFILKHVLFSQGCVFKL